MSSIVAHRFDTAPQYTERQARIDAAKPMDPCDAWCPEFPSALCVHCGLHSRPEFVLCVECLLGMEDGRGSLSNIIRGKVKRYRRRMGLLAVASEAS